MSGLFMAILYSVIGVIVITAVVVITAGWVLSDPKPKKKSVKRSRKRKSIKSTKSNNSNK